MPAPPIDNPTPYTCPNCGAGLWKLADFCPHCGARLEKSKVAPSAGAIIATLFLALGVLVFGAIGACSGLFTYGSLTAHDAELGQGLLVISIPLLIVGLLGCFFCGRAVFRRAR